MTGLQIAGLVLGALFGLIGLRGTAALVREAPAEESGRVRFLVALHDAARAGFWFALGGSLVVLSLVEDPFAYRWLALAPILLAGLRLSAAYWLSRAP